MEYKEKLKHPLWQKKKCEIMLRDGFKCQKCGSEEKTLHVHHIRYDNVKNGNPWECPDEDLVTWCEECHSAYHHGKMIEEMNYNYVNSFWGFNNLIVDFLEEKNKEWLKERSDFLYDKYGICLSTFYEKKREFFKKEDSFVPVTILRIDKDKLNKCAIEWNAIYKKNNEATGSEHSDGSCP